MPKNVKVYDKQENQLLFECQIDEIEKAYEFAKEMEALGIDVEIKAPSLPETLAYGLGAKNEELGTLKQEIIDEVLSHEGSCCHTDEQTNPLKQ